jgi:hypothetical protein
MCVIDFVVASVSSFAAWFSGTGHAPGEVLYWASQIVLAGVALVTAAIAYRQIKAFGALELVKFMQQDTIRNARLHVRNKLANKPFSQWDDDDKQKASTVCSSFDLMGFLLRKKLAPRKAYIRLYAATVQRLHHNLADYLAYERSPTQNGPDFWNCFTWLDEQAKLIQPFNPLDPSTPPPKHSGD